MAFGSLVPGMPPMPIPQMRPNAMMQQGAQIMSMAQRPGAPQGLLQRLLNPAAPPAVTGAPMDLAAPGMPPNGQPAPMNPGQMGLLGRLFPGLMGQQPPQQPAPMAPDPNAVPPNLLGGLY